MKVLIKPSIYSHECIEYDVNMSTHNFFMNILRKVHIGAKTSAKNMIVGGLIDNPKIFCGDIWCGASNISYITAIMLDFDDNVSIQEFIDKYSEYTFYGYTSYNHFKYKRDGGADRFRIMMPLDRPVPMEYWGQSWIKKPLTKFFDGCDVSCFDRGHWQVLPCAETIDKYDAWYNIGKTFSLDILRHEMMSLKRDHDLAIEKREYERAHRVFDDDYNREEHIRAFFSRYIRPELEALDINCRGGNRGTNRAIGSLFGRMMSHPKIDFDAWEVEDMFMPFASDPQTIKDIKGWKNFFEK